MPTKNASKNKKTTTTEKKAVASKTSTAKASTTKAVAKKPATSKVVTTKTSTTKAVAKKPATSKVATTKTSETKAVAKKPATSKVATTKTSATKAVAKKPATSKVATTKASAAKAVAKKTATSKVATTKTSATKAVAKKPATSKVATTKASAKKPAPQKKLTEADILAWDGPESDYMNAAQLAYFREVLLQMQEDIISKASNTADYLQDQEATPDPADRATLEEEYSLELRTRDRERKLLNKVQSSLRQIDEGTYGYCLDSGEIIGLKRLLIRPTATLSVEAQERREQMKKQFAD